MADFVVIFKVNFAIHRFCADQTSIFDIVLTEVIIFLLFQQQSLQKWTNGKAFNILASVHFLAT